jgi:imidazolonepropionase-like amidohydrolase
MTIALKASRIFDGKSDRVEASGVVLVEGEAIAACGPDLRIPAGAQRIDLGDVTLCPGFIDAHTHLTVGVKSYNEYFIDRFRQHVAEKAYQAAVNARVTLESGFTTVRDVGCLYPDSFIDVSLRNAIAKGQIPGPRMLVAINLIGATGGHSDRNAGLHFRATGRESDYTDGIADSPADLRKAVRFNVKYGADVIKFCASGGVMSLADEVDTPQLTLDEMTAVVDEAHRLRKRVAVHCHGDRAAIDAIDAGVDSIEHGTFLRDETFEAMKAKGVFLVPTLLVQNQLGRGLDRLPPELVVKARQAVEAAPAMVRRALAIGVRIALGTDSGVCRHGINAREMPLLVEAGMSPLAALKSATSVNAELLGLSSRIGTLEAGKRADVIALAGDPGEDIRAAEKVVFIMKDGNVVRTGNRQRN